MKFQPGDRVSNGYRQGVVRKREAGRVELPGMTEAEVFLIMYTVLFDDGDQEVLSSSALDRL